MIQEIKAQDLRIGNKFINPKFPNILDEVQQIHSEYAISDYSDSIAITDMLPAPLTPELLERCGFVKCEQLSVMGSLEYTKPVGPEFYRKLLLTKNPLIANNWISHFITGDKLGSSLPTMEYLHQLQNLYFALTSTELTIQQK